MSCSAFKRAVNMSPASIKAWAKDARAREASFAATRRRLPRLAQLKAKPCPRWTPQDEKLAKRVLSFVARMGAVARRKCPRRAVISLRNWGHQPRGCAVPARKR